ncbi:hypothetical protein CEXT_57561, partial [Caerostris extrusa]
KIIPSKSIPEKRIEMSLLSLQELAHRQVSMGQFFWKRHGCTSIEDPFTLKQKELQYAFFSSKLSV